MFPFLPSLACHNINKWPPPRPGQLLQLPLLGQLIYVREEEEEISCSSLSPSLPPSQVRVPLKTDKPEVSNTMMPDTLGKSVRLTVPLTHKLCSFFNHCDN